jgi:hypothetical protein
VPQSHGMLYTHCPEIERFPMRPNFSEVPLTYDIMTVPCYIGSEEGRFLVDSFIMESTDSFGHLFSFQNDVEGTDIF